MPAGLPAHMRLPVVLGGKEPVTAGGWAPALWGHVLQVLLGVNVEAAPRREPGTAPFYRTHKGLCAQVGDAVALQVLCPRKRLPTALHRAGKPPVILVFPFVP